MSTPETPQAPDHPRWALWPAVIAALAALVGAGIGGVVTVTVTHDQLRHADQLDNRQQRRTTYAAYLSAMTTMDLVDDSGALAITQGHAAALSPTDEAAGQRDFVDLYRAQAEVVIVGTDAADKATQAIIHDVMDEVAVLGQPNVQRYYRARAQEAADRAQLIRIMKKDVGN